MTVMRSYMIDEDAILEQIAVWDMMWLHKMAVDYFPEIFRFIEKHLLRSFEEIAIVKDSACVELWAGVPGIAESTVML